MSTVESVRPASAPRYELYVEEQLERARTRVRLLDLGSAVLAISVGTLTYGIGMAVVDRWFQLPNAVRLGAFVAFVLALAIYAAITLAGPLWGRVNPYYAAQQVEHAVPGTKNSVINWLDLHDRSLPGVVRGAVTHRAAKDLARADLDQAISARRTAWLAGAVLVLLACLAVLFFQGPPQFFSLLGRAFLPFGESPLATRTQLTVIQPEGGNGMVAVGRAVTVVVRVDGKMPDPNRTDALRFLFRYQAGVPYEERRPEPGNANGEWLVTVPDHEVHNGFWYRFTGGDTETPEYRIEVHSRPLLADFDVQYHYRPYLNRPDDAAHDPNLEAMRGTEVTLVARTNRAVKDGRLQFVPKEPPAQITDEHVIPAEILADDARAMRFRFPLEQDGSYRIWFLAKDGENNGDPMPYSVHALPDHAPSVELTKPGSDITLPSNGLLRLEGSASDDFGVSALALHVFVGREKPPRPYRGGKPLRRPDGSFPLKVEYRDFLELDRIEVDGQPLQPGMVLEYWLEARDNCDYPDGKPNVGLSQRFKVKIGNVERDRNRQERERQEARAAQHQQEAAQDGSAADAQQQPAGNGDRAAEKQATDPARPPHPATAPPPNSRAEQDHDRKLREQAERLEQALSEEQKSEEPKPPQSREDGAPKNDAAERTKSGERRESRSKSEQLNGRGNDNPESTRNPAQENAGEPSSTGDGDSKPRSDGSGKEGSSRAEPSRGGEGVSPPTGTGEHGGSQGSQSGDTGNGKDGASNGSGEKTQSQAGSGEGERATGAVEGKQPSNGSAKASERGSDGSGHSSAKDSANGSDRSVQGSQGASEKPSDSPGSGNANSGANGQSTSSNEGNQVGAANPQVPQPGASTGSNAEPKSQGPKSSGEGAARRNAGTAEKPIGSASNPGEASAGRGGKSNSGGMGALEQGRASPGAHGENRQGAESVQRNSAKDRSGEHSKPPVKSTDSKGSSVKKGGQASARSGGSQQGRTGGKSSAGSQGANSSPSQTGSGAPGQMGPSQSGTSGQPGSPPGQAANGTEGQAGGAPSSGSEGAKSSPSQTGSGAPGQAGPSPSGASSQPGDRSGKGASGTEGQAGGPPSSGSEGADSSPSQTGSGAPGQTGPSSPGASGQPGERPGKGASPSNRSGENASGESGQAEGSAGGGNPSKSSARDRADGKLGGQSEQRPTGATGKNGQPGGVQRDGETAGNPPKNSEQEGGSSPAETGTKASAKPGAASPDSAARPVENKDVPDLIDALQHGNAEVRRDAARRLGDARDRVTDPRLKQAINEALSRSEASGSPAPSEAAHETQAPSDGRAGGDAAMGHPSGSPPSGGSTSETPAGAGNARQAQSNSPRDASGAMAPNGPGSGSLTTPGRRSGGQPGMEQHPGDWGGNWRGEQRGPVRTQSEPDQGATSPDARFGARAGELQLENIMRRVNQDVLKKANMTEEEYRRWLKDYAEMLRRRPPTDGADRLTDPRARGGILSNRGARRPQTRPGAKDDPLSHAAPTAPPPEFRDAYREFTQKLPTVESGGDK